eukprot:TRINITY_DN22124_c0_g1_i1.p3 TRINITY_DN22124_c0_g1~~TRINITY_DN22124_c0_g1_i1.p3  ORF type:complete len:105 (-),score=7.88 TRINITY_DN22124_c0_g1_i1:225-539(-)
MATSYKKQLYQRVPRQVTMQWVGVASTVRVMGDFDNWTRGQELSRIDGMEGQDSVFGSFETVLSLTPGTYRIKLLVDDKWRLASDWPSELDESTNETNNVIVIE